MIKYLIALFLLTVTAIPTHACRVPKYPLNPATTKSDVIIVGRVFNVRLNEPIQGKWFSVKLEAVVLGEFAAPAYDTGWLTGGGTCGPTGPDVDEGDQVAIYFRYLDGKRVEQGWTKIASTGASISANESPPQPERAR
ncbi:hypothetical protein [Sphingomonas sp.]|uniref:hypothetical protein n=1 Tax=Sphingomonas sp. TaxID=28214 RepID=UPI002EDB85A3